MGNFDVNVKVEIGHKSLEDGYNHNTYIELEKLIYKIPNSFVEKIAQALTNLRRLVPVDGAGGIYRYPLPPTSAILSRTYATAKHTISNDQHLTFN